MAQGFDLVNFKPCWMPDTENLPELAKELSAAALQRFEAALRESGGAVVDTRFNWDMDRKTPKPEGAFIHRVFVEIPVTEFHKYSLAAAFVPPMVDALAWKAREDGIRKFGLLGRAPAVEGGVSTGDMASIHFVMQMGKDGRGEWAQSISLAFIGGK